MKSQIYEPVIELEIHAQLLTKTKLFCGCSTRYGNPATSLTCPACLGLSGALSEFPLSSKMLANLILLVEKKEITHRIAREKVFPEMLKSRERATDIVREKGLGQISDEGKIKEIILHIIEKNPKPLKQYREGKVKALGFFVGQVMKETRGAANPQLINKLLKEILDGYKN